MSRARPTLFEGSAEVGAGPAQQEAHDLSERQIEENRKQAQEICGDNLPAWIVGDGRRAAELAPRAYDLVLLVLALRKP